MSLFAKNSTAIPVHGAWADGSSWNQVVLPLLQEGLQVICAPVPLTSLSEDIAALNRVIARQKVRYYWLRTRMPERSSQAPQTSGLDRLCMWQLLLPTRARPLLMYFIANHLTRRLLVCSLTGRFDLDDQRRVPKRFRPKLFERNEGA
jgi:hypothetical protein